MIFAPTYTLAEANALIPYLTDELARLRSAIVRARELEANSKAPAQAAGEQTSPAAQSASPEEKKALEAEVNDAIAALARVGAGVRLDPPGVEVRALFDGDPVRLHFIEGHDAFDLWRDDEGQLHAVDDPDDFGPNLPQ